MKQAYRSKIEKGKEEQKLPSMHKQEGSRIKSGKPIHLDDQLSKSRLDKQKHIEQKAGNNVDL